MKIAYFDCFSGISGDMAVGALIDAGAPLAVVEDALRAVGITDADATVSIRTIVRHQIHATKFVVDLPVHHAVGADEPEIQREEFAGHKREGHRHHTHHHTHHHASTELDAGGSYHDPAHEHSTYASIIHRIDTSRLATDVRDLARAIFRAIGLAEARIHGTTLDAVHFHEVGAVDSIADIVAFAACLDHLGIEEVYTSAIPLGSGGMISTQHGTMPLPAPATLEILKGYPVALTTLPFELTTPTGAGMVKALSRGTLATEVLQVERVGFGAGTRDLPDRPNLLRVVVGELVGAEERDHVTVIESNIDDMNPQVYPYLLERLLESGALDAFLTPVIMKKGRPGMLLTVMAPRGAVDELTKVIYRETTTIGLRYHEVSRRRLRREEIVAPTEWGSVRMKKVVSSDGIRVTPEFDEVRRIASERAIPLHIVMERLDDVARRVADEASVGRADTRGL